MRKLVLCFSLLMLFSCSHKNEVRIEGEVENGNGRVLHLSLLTADGLQAVDSLVVRRNSFCFSVKPKTIAQITGSDDPVFLQLSFADDNALTTLARSGETVCFKVNANKLVSSYHVEGPEDAMLMWQLDSALSCFAQYTDTLLQIYQYYMDDDSIRSGVEQRYNLAVERHTQYLRDFIQRHPYSFSAMIAFYQIYNRHRFFDEYEDAELLQLLTDSLAACYPESRYVAYLQSRIR